MPAHEFVFRVALSDGAPFDAMVADITRTVLGHIGYTPETIAELIEQLRGALGGRAGRASERHLAFRAHNGQLHIAAGCGDRVEWQTARPLP